jgi:hypothetical protein
VYLVEESAVEAAPAFGWEGIYTAITQTQVETDFFVKRTWTAHDSADYLAALTRCIQASLQVMPTLLVFKYIQISANFVFNLL